MTTPTRSQIEELVFASLDDLNQMLPEESQAPRDVSVRLIGKGAAIDSMGLVSLIVGIEERLVDQYGIAVTLVDDRAMSQERSPFLTLATLTDFVVEIVDSDAGG